MAIQRLKPTIARSFKPKEFRLPHQDGPVGNQEPPRMREKDPPEINLPSLQATLLFHWENVVNCRIQGSSRPEY